MQHGRFVVGIGPLGRRTSVGSFYELVGLAGSGEQDPAGSGECRRLGAFHGTGGPSMSIPDGPKVGPEVADAQAAAAMRVVCVRG
jgi:hypothetical protein